MDKPKEQVLTLFADTQRLTVKWVTYSTGQMNLLMESTESLATQLGLLELARLELRGEVQGTCVLDSSESKATQFGLLKLASDFLENMQRIGAAQAMAAAHPIVRPGASARLS